MCIFVKVCGYDVEIPALEVNHEAYILDLANIIAQKLIRSAAPLGGRQFKHGFRSHITSCIAIENSNK